MGDAVVALRPYGEGDLPLLERLLGDPRMMVHLGGPESPQQIRSRHERYCRLNEDGPSRLSVIVTARGSEAAGWVGYWPRDWRGQAVWEAGWHVLPEFQGRGLATAGTRAMLARAASEGTCRYLHAFPSAANAASNAVCAKVGFTSLGETEFEYPPGHAMRCIDWRFDLEAAGAHSTTAER